MKLFFILSLTLVLCQAQFVLNNRFGSEQFDRTGPFWDALRDNPNLTATSLVDVIHRLLKAAKSSSFPTAVAKNISQQCIDDSIYYVHSYYNLSTWALQMHESTGQYPEGLLSSFQVTAMGLFDECLAVKAPRGFQGKYCSVFFSSTTVDSNDFKEESPTNDLASRDNWITFYQLLQLLNLLSPGALQPIKPQVSNFTNNLTTFFTPSIGFCIPSSCSTSDFRSAVAQLVGSYASNNTATLTVTDDRFCFVESDDAPNFDGPDIAVLVTLSIIGFLVVVGTIFESSRLLMKKPIDPNKDSWFARAMHCFSAISNGRKLLSTKSSGSDNLSCVHGIRFLSTTWVIMGHTWNHSVFQPNYSRFLLQQDANKWEMQGIINATVSVDSFFLLSGLLLAYLLLKEIERNKGRFNILLFYIHRILRLTPVYAIILGFEATLVVYLGKGPFWFSMNYIANGCRNGWWYNLLYINNLVSLGPEELCKGETWYLANDMQLFLLSPLIIYPMWRWRKASLAFLLVLMFGSLAANFALFAIYELPATLLPTRPQDLTDYMAIYYQKPWVRAPPYLIGIFLGWSLYQTRNHQIKFSKASVAFGWTLATGIGLSVVYGMIPYIQNSVEISTYVNIFYGSLHRFAWALALGWVVFACVKGYGGCVNRLLSWRAFMPLSRLTYCAYLIHWTYISFFYAHSRKPFYFTTFDQVHTYFGFLVAVFGLSFIVSLTVEAPFLNLEKLIFSPMSNNKTQVPRPVTTEVTVQVNNPDVNGKSNEAFLKDVE